MPDQKHMSFLTNSVRIEYRLIFKSGVNAQLIYPDINVQVIFHSELCNAWIYAQDFLPASFVCSIGHFLILGFNAQACLVLHTGLFYLLVLNRVGHFNYPGFNAQGFLVCNSQHFAQVIFSWHSTQVKLSWRFAQVISL